MTDLYLHPAAAQPAEAQDWRIRSEAPEDVAAIDSLNARSFGPGRFAKSAYRLREGVGPVTTLSFVAVEGLALCGSIRFWPIAVGREPSLLLGPLAVAPDRRGRGIGVALMRRGIEAARGLGYVSIILVGDEPYYVRVGFARIAPGKVRLPGPVDPARVLGLSLKPNAMLTLSGEVRRPRLAEPVSACAAAVAG
jgi:predicted N-acetyltransferase YhbS